jgi:hypothetical protein
MSVRAITEILNDTVENKELIPEFLEMIKRLEVISVDIVKSIAEEANIYNTADAELFDIFNLKRIEDRYELYEKVKTGKVEKEVVILENYRIELIRRGREIYDEDSNYIGRIHMHETSKNQITLNRLFGENDSRKTKNYFTENLTHTIICFMVQAY